MAVKGFYFSFDGLIGLMLMGLASSLILLSVEPEITADDISQLQFSHQSNDIAHLMQNEEMSDLPEHAETRYYNHSVAEYLVIEEDDEAAEAYLESFDHETGLYIDDEEVVESDFEVSESARIAVMGEEELKTLTVVTGR